jgi:hypothetical protein
VSVTLNGYTPPQPTSIKEELKQIYHERMTVQGTLLRIFFGVKQQCTLTWNYLQPADYATLVSLFTSGQPIVYLNTTSTYGGGGTCTFTGFPMQDEGDYVKGASLLRSMTVQIRQQ